MVPFSHCNHIQEAEAEKVVAAKAVQRVADQQAQECRDLSTFGIRLQMHLLKFVVL
jgi:hypothetical protein